VYMRRFVKGWKTGGHEKRLVHPEPAYFSQVFPQQSATPRIF